MKFGNDSHYSFSIFNDNFSMRVSLYIYFIQMIFTVFFKEQMIVHFLIWLKNDLDL